MSVVYWARFFREEDGRWSVDLPDMPGCLTFGKTIEEAYQYLTREAIPCWLGQSPWPPARSPEEILELDRFEDDPEPLLVRVVLAENNEAADEPERLYIPRSGFAGTLDASGARV